MLAKNGVNVNCLDGYGQTPLIITIANNYMTREKINIAIKSRNTKTDDHWKNINIY